MNKIIDLSIVSTFKSNDIDRLICIMYNLLILKNDKNVPYVYLLIIFIYVFFSDILDNKLLNSLRHKCATAISTLIIANIDSQKIVSACTQLQELIKKMNRYLLIFVNKKSLKFFILYF